jgi:hypothetical protein
VSWSFFTINAYICSPLYSLSITLYGYDRQPLQDPKSPWQPIVNGLQVPAAVVVVVPAVVVVVPAVVVVVPAVVVVVPAVVVVVPEVVVVPAVVVVVPAVVVVVPAVVVVVPAVVVVGVQLIVGILGVPMYVPCCILVTTPVGQAPSILSDACA